MAPGSEVVIAADLDATEMQLEELEASLQNHSVKFIRADTTSRRVLDRLDVPSFDHIVVLCYADSLDAQRADSRTIITLLHLRDMEERAGLDFSIVSEMLDLRNRALAEVTNADDFIVSARLVSLLMAQVAENAALNAVFADLFDQAGSEIYLRRATDYVADGVEVSFGTVVASARRRGEVAIGYRTVTPRNGSGAGHGVSINPAKSARLTLSNRASRSAGRSRSRRS